MIEKKTVLLCVQDSYKPVMGFSLSSLYCFFFKVRIFSLSFLLVFHLSPYHYFLQYILKKLAQYSWSKSTEQICQAYFTCCGNN